MERTKYALMAMMLALFAGLAPPAEAAIFGTLTALEASDEFGLDPMFNPVGWLGARNSSGGFVAGSGVLIDPYWVLTAGHVINDGTEVEWDTMRFSFSRSIFEDEPNFVEAAEVFAFPGYDDRLEPGKGDDIGLVRLVDPILHVAPAVRWRGDDSQLIGETFYAAGYGAPGVWPNQQTNDGVFRAGENLIDTMGGVSGIVEDHFFVADLDLAAFDNPLAMEWNGSPGDSGGGWFMDTNDQMQLIALNNFVRGLNDVTGGIRLTQYNDWIDLHVNSVPEPSSMLIFGLGLAGMAAIRRRGS